MKRAIRNTQARSSRAKAAKDVIIREIPAILKADARARRGVQAAELIVDPPPFTPAPAILPARDKQQPDVPSPPADKPVPAPTPSPSPPRITLRITDTLEAAHHLLLTSPAPAPRRGRDRRPPRIAVLNMASPLRPGGGVLSGASSQEERLCARTTLHASLREDFYRLPEVGGVYTPDVLVFRRWDDGDGGGGELAKAERFYVDVVSAAMLRFPDLEEEGGGGGEGRQAERTYAEPRDRELVVAKMRAVMRIVRCKGVEKVVLGAWGCGAYGNPVGEIAAAWAKVLLGRRRAKGRVPSCGGSGVAGGDSWEGLEVVFAIKDSKMARRFASAFGPGIEVEEVGLRDAKFPDAAEESDNETEA